MEESAAEEHSASQQGHRKLNQLGGSFVNGKPLPLAIRQQIIQLAESGVRPCDISRQLRVSHGCISKLLSKYNETGSFQPGRAKRKTSRDVSNQVRQKIEDYKRESPGIFSWEVKDRLLQEGQCTKETVPPLSVISRIVRGKSRILSEVSEASDMDSDCSDGGHIPDSPDKTEDEFPFEIASQTRHDKGTEIQNGNVVPADEGAHSPLMRRGSGNGSALSERFYSMDLNKQSNHVTIKHYQRRNRTKFSAEQTSEMEKAYERTQYPDALTREELAERLNISESRIQVWFANRRSKGKKKQKPEAQDPPQAAPAPPVTASHTRVFYPVYPTVPVIRYSPYTHALAPTCCYVPSDVPYWQARAADCHCSSCTVCPDE